MFPNEEDIIRGIAISRKNLVELIIIAVLLSFGINLIAAQFLTLPIATPLVTITTGSILCLTAIIYAAIGLFGKRIKSKTYNAFIAFEHDKNTLIPVNNYDFASEIATYIEAACAENAAIKARWESQPLRTSSFTKKSESYSFRLLTEAAEYFFLDKLSTNLIDYFNDTKFEEKHLQTYERADIPTILLSNTFLELFSKPMEERPAFLEANEKDEENTELIAFYAKGIGMFNRFDLTLPKGSKVIRLKNHKMMIETKKLKITMSTHIEGVGAFIPFEFVRYYMGHNDRETYNIHLTINVEVVIKIRSALSVTGWHYYQWIDSFLKDMNEAVSKEAFFKRISWDSTEATIRSLKRVLSQETDLIKKDQKSEDTQTKPPQAE